MNINRKKIIYATAGILISIITLPSLSLATNSNHKKDKTQELLQQLQWVISQNPNNLCHGYYLQPTLDASGQPILPMKDSVTQISADRGILSQKSTSVLTGNIVVLQPGRRLEADKAIIYPSKTGKYKAIDLSGNVRAWEPGELFIARNAYFNLLKKSNRMQDVKYRLVLAKKNDIKQHLSPVNKHTDRIHGTVAWGRAKTVHQIKPKHSVLHDVTYTTCAPNDAQWHLIASKLKLNKETEEGTAENVRLNVGNIPVFYWPYFNFPLSNQRKSGFLFPTVGSSNVSGFIFGLPYYWNIAPNYDDTITPTLYSERGIMFKNRFRYLTPSNSGELKTTFLPDDAKFKRFRNSAAENFPNQFGLKGLLKSDNDRYSVIWHNDTYFNQNWSSYIDYGLVSDDYYFQDFGDIPEEIATNQVLQKGELEYRSQHWTMTSVVQHYQTLHPVNRQPISSPYAELPQINLNGHYPDIWHGVNFTWKSQGTYFRRGALPGQTESVNGGRFEIRPGFNRPFNWIWGFFDPGVQLDVTEYSLQNQVRGEASEITRTLPIVDADAGLFFQRDTDIFHQSYEQTLEPELYYLYVPFRGQEDIPNFDTGFIPFTYSQLFANNRFSGLDRISDANQISYSLTTRFINQKTGDQKFRFSIGEIYYFREPQVRLINNDDPEKFNDFTLGFGTPPIDERFSPIATLMTYNITPTWSMSGGYAWDPNIDRSITGSYYFTFSPAPNHIIDFGYTFIRNGDVIDPSDLDSSKNDLNAFSIDSAWPITPRWSAIEIFSYNINQKRPQTYLAGLAYNSCCFRIRFVGGRTFSNINQDGKVERNNSVYLQIQFKGLGNIGTNSLSNILTSNISGFIDPFQSNSFGNVEV